MKVTVIPIVICAFGTVTKGLSKGLEDLEFEGRVVTVQTTAFLRTASKLRRVLETWVDICHSNSSERPSAKTDVKNSQWVNNNNNNIRSNCYTCSSSSSILFEFHICRNHTGHWPSVRVFANGPEDLSSIARSSHTKDSRNGTWCLLA